MAQNPMTISAVIPAYNCEKYIARSIDSVLNQTHPIDEIVVVDDGSKDNTAEIIKSYGDKVRYLHQDNAGVSAARNAGIHAAKSEWIAFLDADDEWLPTYLEKQIEVLQLNSDLVWSTANFHTCSCAENRMSPWVIPAVAEKLWDRNKTCSNYLLAAVQDFGGCTDTMIVRKDALFEAGLFREDLHKGEDLDLWWRIAYHHQRFGLIAEPLAIYHLGIQGSGNKKIEDWKHYAALISEHLKLAEKLGQLSNFQRLASRLVRGWMRSMLFRAQKEDIRQLLCKFRNLIPFWYRWLMYTLTVFPKLTKAICLLISKVVRRLHLRRRVVVPPNVAENKKKDI